MKIVFKWIFAQTQSFLADLQKLFSSYMRLASSSAGCPNLNFFFYFEIVKDKGYSMKSSFIGYVFILKETFPCHCASYLISSLQTANTTTKALSFSLCALLIMVKTKAQKGGTNKKS